MEAVRRVRTMRGMNQVELAEASGVAQNTISEIELGKREARPGTLKKLADALDVEIADFFREPAVPLAEAPRGAGQAESSTQPVEEFERRLAHVLEPVRADALREAQAASRLISSQGIPQSLIGDIPEAETADRFVHELSPEERPLAFGELALGYARYERAMANLEANYTNTQGLLRERDEKIADLEAKIERLRQDLAEYRAEAEREQETTR